MQTIIKSDDIDSQEKPGLLRERLSSFLEPKHVYRRLEALFGEAQATGSTEMSARWFLRLFFEKLAPTMQVESVHLYERSPEGIRLVFGEGIEAEDASLDLPRPSDLPWVGMLNGRLAAVVPFGQKETLLMVFFVDGSIRTKPGELFYSNFSSVFSSLHYALVQNLRLRELQDVFEQSRAIQMSLLPPRVPELAGFDLAAVSIPASRVGGDLYDFQKLNSESIVVTVADAAGHGLPAALQARDVITGLRMGIETGVHLPGLVEKLNNVIHRSGLVSRFISMVLGQLDRNGDFSYINAGHPRPILIGRAGFQELSTGGMILGPNPSSKYSAGFVHLDPGDALVLFSDGLTEHQNPDGAEFGTDNLKSWLTARRHDCAEDSLQALFRELDRFGMGKSFQDDVTVMLIRRLPHWF